VTARVLVLGSTGSIGIQALDVIDACDDLILCGLACGTQLATMATQRGPAAVPTSCAAGGGTIPWSADLGSLIDATEPDIVLNALVGAAGLPPTLAALERGVTVALANKESLVAGGEVVARARRASGARLIPVDSEHSSLFQLLEGVPRERVQSLVLTASGGPFRGKTASDLADVGPADALRHPTWTMGAKITIDSATLMNKGLEIIEAHHLFDVGYDVIEVLVHPQSVVHGLVTLDDGSLLAHCGAPDMRIPIGHALCYPDAPPRRPPLNLVGMTLTFEPADEETFRCLALAREAGRAGGTMPAVLNAANEVAVQAFLDSRIGFLDIARLVENTLGVVARGEGDTLEAVIAADRAARSYVDSQLAPR
jgi:1-deoxy-D-xylulose-5-phosphate reductoisomerase